MGMACNTHWIDENNVQNFGWKSGGKTPLGRPRCRRKDNIKMDLREMKWGCVE
jgi:hypothetical protein